MARKFIKTLPGLILLSLLIHLSFLGGASLMSWNSESHIADKKPVEIVILPKTPQNSQPRQIVEQDKKRVNDETPDKDYYLGRHNQRVARQTRAAKTGNYTNEAQPGQKAMGAKKTKTKRKAAQRKKLDGTLPSLKDLSPTFNAQADFGKFVNPVPGKESKTSDHLKDLETGPQTLLSTREFVYYSYYQRIRSKIRQRWEPIIRQKVRRVFAQGRSIASARDRVTKVVIILNEAGHLIGVQVVSESGVSDLDDAAVEAFRAAEPFPNPPKGIVENDGTIKIRWDFILEA